MAQRELTTENSADTKRESKRLTRSELKQLYQRDLEDEEILRSMNILKLPDPNSQYPHFEVTPEFNAENAVRLLASVEKKQCTKKAPVALHPNKVYVYRITEDSLKQYWRRDLQTWIARDSHDHPKASEKPFIRRYLQKHATIAGAVRTEYWPVGYLLNEQSKWRPKYVIVHYNDQCHWNKDKKKMEKSNLRKKISSVESVLGLPKSGESMDDSMNSDGRKESTDSEEDEASKKKHKYSKNHPMVGDAIQRELLKGTRGVALDRLLTTKTAGFKANEKLCPKNLSSIRYQERKLKVATHGDVDDIADVWAFGLDNPEVVIKADFLPYLVVVQTHPEVLKHMKELKRKNQKIHLYYDTTYHIAQAYASVLGMKHFLFENEPMLKVGAVFHQSRHQKYSHDVFFKNLVDHFPGINSSKVLIITDREPAIKASIAKYLDKCTHLYCHIHLKQNVARNLKRMALKSAERWNIIKSIRSLLFAETEADFNALYMYLRPAVLVTSPKSQRLDNDGSPNTSGKDSMTDEDLTELEAYDDDQYNDLTEDEKNQLLQFDKSAEVPLIADLLPWPAKFGKYFDRFLEQDVRKCARFATEKFGIFNKLTGFTTNPIEGIHHQFKLNRRISSFMTNIREFYRMQTTDMVQVNMAMDKKPKDWTLKSTCTLVLKGVAPYVLADCRIVHPELISPTPELVALEGPNINIKRTEAANIVKANGVLVLDNGFAAVSHLGENMYLVNYPKSKCTCRRPPKCVHIMAVHIKLHGANDKQFQFLFDKKVKPLQAVYQSTIDVTTGKKGSWLGKKPEFYGKDERETNEGSDGSASNHRKSPGEQDSVDVEQEQAGSLEWPENELALVKDYLPSSWPEFLDRPTAGSFYAGTGESVTSGTSTSTATEWLEADRNLLPNYTTHNVKMIRVGFDLFEKDLKRIVGYKATEPNKITASTARWLEDGVMAVYFSTIFKDVPTVLTLTPLQLKCFMDRTEPLASLSDFWTIKPQMNYIVAPMHVNEDHWIYVEVDLKNKLIRTADSQGSHVLQSKQASNLKATLELILAAAPVGWMDQNTVDMQASSHMNEVTFDLRWLLPKSRNEKSIRDQVVPPSSQRSTSFKSLQMTCSKQGDAESCGVYTCAFALYRLHSASLTSPVKKDRMRHHIFHTIIQNCDVSTYKCAKHLPHYPCPLCKMDHDDGEQVATCERCGTRTHIACLQLRKAETKLESFVCISPR